MAFCVVYLLKIKKMQDNNIIEKIKDGAVVVLAVLVSLIIYIIEKIKGRQNKK